MVDCEYSPNAHKSLKISIVAIIENPNMVRSNMVNLIILKAKARVKMQLSKCNRVQKVQ